MLASAGVTATAPRKNEQAMSVDLTQATFHDRVGGGVSAPPPITTIISLAAAPSCHKTVGLQNIRPAGIQRRKTARPQGAQSEIPAPIMECLRQGFTRSPKPRANQVGLGKNALGATRMEGAGFRLMSETSLYPAIKRFLETAGFDAKGEVRGCDIVAVRPGEPPTVTIVEMKLGLTLELLLQATDRMRAADEVWLAVPATRRGRDRDPRAHRLCRLLGYGLLAVSTARDRVEVLVAPGPYKPRPDLKRRSRLLLEHGRRRGDPSPGGTGRQPIMTAYRQQALACAALLRAGPGRVVDLRAVAPDAGSILRRNVYGWFERCRRGVYQLTAAGEAALRQWPEADLQPAIGPRSDAASNGTDRDAAVA